MKVLCIIPVFNEEKFLKGTITSIKQHNFGVDKFLFFDSGSTDSSGKILKEEKYETITLSKNQGIGNILIKGIDYCIKNKFDVITVIHGGNKMDTKDFETVLSPILKSECDYVYGSRFKENTVTNMPQFRKFSTPLLSNLVSIFYGKTVTDATNGFKAYKVNDILQVLPKYNRKWLYGYAFEGFLFGKMLNSKFNGSEVPVTITYDKSSKHTKIRPFVDYPSIVFPFFLAKLIN